MLKLILVLNLFLVLTALNKINGEELACLDSNSHKPAPSAEFSLKGECKIWQSLSCCNTTTTDVLHADNNYWYNFNYDHCYRLSNKCRRRFRQELCFYECDPYLGLWIVKVYNFY